MNTTAYVCIEKYEQYYVDTLLSEANDTVTRPRSCFSRLDENGNESSFIYWLISQKAMFSFSKLFLPFRRK